MKNHTKHTPGPWRVFEEYQRDNMLVTADDGRRWLSSMRRIAASDLDVQIAEVVADIGDIKGYPSVGSNEEMLANASLISAAPELLAALVDLFDDVDNGGVCAKTMDAAQRAIAKARGES